MQPITLCLTAATLTASTGTAFLALLRTGIARQERAASLTTRPRGLGAALARRVLGLRADPPHPAREPRPVQAEPTHSARSRKAGTP